ncbi:HAD family hydrolase [Thetidibacter halocola]|uniref:HAD family phosphatase n=1 Tax=Thetidibacter halocola TaxID=2827239 RepID=A0A8J8B8V1_9RHOB|nr:HAD family phosphatase [Thetidibacter halocola]MBS0124905.1 HAD family phosphatase [Thetidibacter halocola]
MTTIVFDIGNVLVRWDPRAAFRSALGSDAEVDAFLDRTGFFARNHRADAGETFAALAQELDDPRDRALLAGYVDCYGLTIREPIEGTWALIDRLRRRGHALHAITNWSAENWDTGLALHPRLREAFGVTIVSGQERIIKPDRAIFDLLCDRAGVVAQDCLFIDDSPANVDGARAAGWQAHHFTTPEALEADLTQRGLL